MKITVLDSKQLNGKKWNLCKANLLEYIQGLKSDFYSFEIQRRIVKNQYLDSLLETIKIKEPIPVITLTSNIPIENDRECDLNNIEILDGLQRTYRLWCYYELYKLYENNRETFDKSDSDIYNSFALKIKEDSTCSEFIESRIINSKIIKSLSKKNQNGVFEIANIESYYSEFELYFIIWENLNEKELIKKMLILNAGQSQVTTTHQYEILFLHYLDSIRTSLTVLREKDVISNKARRGDREIGMFLFSSLIVALQSFIAQRPMMAVKEDTLLKAENHFDSDDTLALVFEDSFLQLFSKKLKELDEVVCNKEYKGKSWFVKDTTLSGFWGAIGDYIKINEISDRDELKEKFNEICDLMKSIIGSQGLDLDNYEKEYNTLSSRTINIGSTVRKAVYKYVKSMLNSGDMIGTNWSIAFEKNKEDK